MRGCVLGTSVLRATGYKTCTREYRHRGGQDESAILAEQERYALRIVYGEPKIDPRRTTHGTVTLALVVVMRQQVM